MYRQVRRLSASVLWSTPPLKYTSLQALSVLCLWSATVQTEIPMDSWLLSGISINHAIISFDFLDQLLVEPAMTDDMLQKLRVWNALCLAQLQYVSCPSVDLFARLTRTALRLDMLARST